MCNINKSLASALVLVMIISSTSLLMVKPANAQSTFKPTSPEFTIKYTNTVTSYPPTPTIDPYTGKTTYVGGGEYNVRQILIIITNQPFTPYVNNTTHQQIGLFYSVRTKGHFAQTWNLVESWIKEAPAYNPLNPYQEQNYSSQNTVLQYGNDFPDDGQIDFQVQALVGYPVITSTSDHIDINNMFVSFSFNGTASDWSDIQTITLHQPYSTSGSPTSTPALSPTVPEFPTLILPLFAIAILLSIVIIRKIPTSSKKKL